MQSERDYEIERQVGTMLGRSPGYRRLPAAQQAQILRDTKAIVATMAENKLAQRRNADPYAVPLAGEDPIFPGMGGDSSSQKPAQQFTGGVQPGAADEAFGPKKQGDFGTGVATGVSQAGALLRQVNFPAFVAELVQGVFQAVVDASIQQMEAYGELVKSVSMSLNDFRDANVSENQARDHLVSKFPSIMQLNVGDDGPKVGLRGDVDSDQLGAISSSLGLSEPLGDLDAETIEQDLVPAARNDLARSRQSLLATMLLMGINRIIVTDGKINAKMKFDFHASDSMTMNAQDYDYKNFGVAKTAEWDHESKDESGESAYTSSVDKETNQRRYESSQGAGSRWSKGTYRAMEAPVIKLTNVTNTQTTAELEASAKLSGEVSLNFRSETFDINKLASADEVFKLERVRSAGRGAPATAAAPTTPATTTTPAAPTTPV